MEKSLYDITFTAGEENQNEYYDYSNNLLRKSLSSYMFRNSKLSEFLEYLQDILVLYINSIKLLRVYKNYNVDKEYTKIE
jgi:hypothetical protein